MYEDQKGGVYGDQKGMYGDQKGGVGRSVPQIKRGIFSSFPEFYPWRGLERRRLERRENGDWVSKNLRAERTRSVLKCTGLLGEQGVDKGEGFVGTSV